MPDVTKIILINKLYASNTDANLEAQQFTQYAGMLERMTPSPSTWSITAKVLKANVFHAHTPRGKARVALEVQATGEEDRIDSWATDYRKLHGLESYASDSLRADLTKIAPASQKETNLDVD